MYKTTVYTLINGRITHQKQKYQKRWYYTQHDIAKVSMCVNVSGFVH